MASRKTKHTKTTTSEEHIHTKKALVCVVHSQGSAGRSFVYFLVAKDLRIDWKSVKISANGGL